MVTVRHKFRQETIGDLIRREGICPAELSRRMGVSRTIVGAWIRGVIKPQVDTLCRLAGVFNVDIAEFFEEVKGSESHLGDSSKVA